MRRGYGMGATVAVPQTTAVASSSPTVLFTIGGFSVTSGEALIVAGMGVAGYAIGGGKGALIGAALPIVAVLAFGLATPGGM